jgi:hypothetical protein
VAGIAKLEQRVPRERESHQGLAKFANVINSVVSENFTSWGAASPLLVRPTM